jgi:hypothetical protein
MPGTLSAHMTIEDRAWPGEGMRYATLKSDPATIHMTSHAGKLNTAAHTPGN